jgi:hypothetical protein
VKVPQPIEPVPASEAARKSGAVHRVFTQTRKPEQAHRLAMEAKAQAAIGNAVTAVKEALSYEQEADDRKGLQQALAELKAVQKNNLARDLSPHGQALLRV